ncbi:MAG: type II toxin-antitoxin system VapC family toxin [Candidatus Nitrotoga sp.]|nr:type II toxin-antitoxin system VapC family toxin [Candidatus Nitrotoga sp.]MDP1855116.1 type II toxin-antitoxin system VapC family toxin [Candidatus Nitrotoga sp.]
MIKKRTYLDTGVLRAAYNGEHKLFEAAFAVIDDPDREFVITDFLKLELLPKPTYFMKTEEVDFYNEFFANAVETQETTPVKTSAALDLACKYGLSAIDAVHLQTAVDADIVEFITTEKTTKPFFRITSSSFLLTSIHQDS